MDEAQRALEAGRERVPGDEYWSTDFAPPGAESALYAIRRFNERLVIGGQFQLVGSTQASGVAVWDGVGWSPIGGGCASVGGRAFVRAMAEFGGELVVAGNFDSAGVIPVQNFAFWNPTALTWSSRGVSVDGMVDALAIWNGKLVLGGDFSQVRDVPAENVALWDGENPIALAQGVTGEVHALAEFRGDLIVAGELTEASGVPLGRIARWDGTSWHALGGGLAGSGFFPGVVYALRVVDDELIAGGAFETADGLPAPNVARWDGTSWHAMGSGFPLIGVLSLVDWNGRLLAGGGCSGGDDDGLAVWNGSEWDVLPGSKLGECSWGGYGGARALFDDDGDLLVGGGFRRVDLKLGWNLARFTGAGIEPMCPGYGLRSPASCLGVSPDLLVVGGQFREVGCVHSPVAAAWDGQTWLDLNTQQSWPDQAVLSSTTFAGHIVVGGRFTSIGGESALNVASWDGAGWHSLGNGIGRSDSGERVSALFEYEGDLFAGGILSEVDGVPIRAMAAWNGTSWRTLPGEVMDSVSGFGRYGSSLVIAGDEVALWDGESFTRLEGLGTGNVFAAVEYRGDLIVGGSFTEAGGAAAFGIARWDGTSWHDLAVGVDGPVRGLVVHNDRLFVGGLFSQAGQELVYGAAKWDGTTWSPLGSGLSWPPSAEHVALFQGSVYFGGEISTAGGVTTRHLARWTEPDNTPIEPVDLHGDRLGTAVRLSWVIRDSGIDRAFHVLRAPVGSGREQITRLPIAAFAAAFLDEAAPRTALDYWLLDVTDSGKTYGPVRIAPMRPGSASATVLRVVPNPTSRGARISFDVEPGATAMLLVVDAQGRMQRKLVENASVQSTESIEWDGRDERGHELPPGTYFVQLRIGDETRTEKVVLAR